MTDNVNTESAKKPSSVNTEKKLGTKSSETTEYEKSELLVITHYKGIRDYLFKKIDSHVGANCTKLFEVAFGPPTFMYKIGKAEYPTWKHQFKDRTFYVFTGSNGTSYECVNAKFDSKEDEAISLEFLQQKITTAIEGNENGKEADGKEEPKQES